MISAAVWLRLLLIAACSSGAVPILLPAAAAAQQGLTGVLASIELDRSGWPYVGFSADRRFMYLFEGPRPEGATGELRGPPARLRVFDVGNPAAPMPLSELTLGAIHGFDMAARGSRVFLLSDGAFAGIQLIDVSDPERPRVAGWQSVEAPQLVVASPDGEIVGVRGMHGLQLFNVSSSGSFSERKRFSPFGVPHILARDGGSVLVDEDGADDVWRLVNVDTGVRNDATLNVAEVKQLGGSRVVTTPEYGTRSTVWAIGGGGASRARTITPRLVDIQDTLGELVLVRPFGTGLGLFDLAVAEPGIPVAENAFGLPVHAAWLLDAHHAVVFEGTALRIVTLTAPTYEPSAIRAVLKSSAGATANPEEIVGRLESAGVGELLQTSGQLDSDERIAVLALYGEALTNIGSNNRLQRRSMDALRVLKTVATLLPAPSSYASLGRLH